MTTSRTRNSVIARSSTGYHGRPLQGDDGHDQRETDDRDGHRHEPAGALPQRTGRVGRRRLVQVGHEGESVSRVHPCLGAPPLALCPSWTPLPRPPLSRPGRARSATGGRPRHRSTTTPRRSCSAARAGCGAAPTGAVGTWVGIAVVARARGHPAARALPLHRRDDGRGLHALLPRAHAHGRRPQRRLPAPLRAGIAARPRRLVRAVRLLPGRRADVRPAPAPRHHLRAVRAGPGVGPAGRHRRRRARRVLRADADRAHGDGLERRPRPDAVERGVRRPRRCTSTTRAGGGGPGSSPACSPGSPSRYRPDLVIAVGLVARLAAVAPPRRPPPGPRSAALVGLLPMWVHLVDGRAGRRLRGHGPRPGVPACAPAASCPGRRRGAASTARLQAVAEEIPPWWKLPHLPASHAAVPVVLRDARWARSRCSAFAVWQRRRPDGRTGRSTALLAVALVSVGILPQALQRPDSAHLLWVTCVSLPFAVVAVDRGRAALAPRSTGARRSPLGAASRSP